MLTDQIRVRCTAKEKLQIYREAHACGLSMSEYLLVLAGVRQFKKAEKNDIAIRL